MSDDAVLLPLLNKCRNLLKELRFKLCDRITAESAARLITGLNSPQIPRLGLTMTKIPMRRKRTRTTRRKKKTKRRRRRRRKTKKRRRNSKEDAYACE